MHNPKELIAYAKANAGKLSFSSSGVGNPQQLAGELMNMMAGTNVLHVPYRGAAPAVTDVATGAVTMSFTSLAAALPLIQAGKLRAVAVTSQGADAAIAGRGAAAAKARRGLRATSCSTGSGCSAPPARRPRSSTASTASSTRRSTDPAIADKLMPQGIVPRLMTAKEFKSFVDSETEKFGKIVEQANIKLEQLAAFSVYIIGAPSGRKPMNVKPNTQNAKPVDDLRSRHRAPAGHAVAEDAVSRLRDEDAAVRSQERARHHADARWRRARCCPTTSTC